MSIYEIWHTLENKQTVKAIDSKFGVLNRGNALNAQFINTTANAANITTSPLKWQRKLLHFGMLTSLFNVQNRSC